MSYDATETSRYSGKPVEAFRFVQGQNTWLFTSADTQVTLPIGVFEKETIQRSELSFSEEEKGEKIEVTVPRDNPIAELFILDLPSTPVFLTVFRAHRGEEEDEIAIFTGKVSRVSFKGSEAVLSCSSLVAVLDRAVPLLAMQMPCNHVLFSAECGANPTASRDAVTITTVDRTTVTSNDFALRPDQWFRGGRLVTPDFETRFIADHIGDTITLLSALPGLESLDECWAYWGCDHLEATCKTKYSNLDNYLGFSRIPGRNPFEGRID